MKKLLSVLGAFVMCFAMSFAFVGCGAKQANQTVELSMNPEIVFAFDNSGKVTSVSYKTEETNQIFVNVNFVGQSIDQAMESFVNYSLISGHIDLAGETVEILANAGTDAKIADLKTKTQTALENAFEKLAIDVTVSSEALDAEAVKEALYEQVRALAPEKSIAELKNMTAEQLVQIIDQKQKEVSALTFNQIQTISQSFATGVNKTIKTVLEQANAALATAQANLDAAKEAIGTNLQSLQAILDSAKQTFNEAVVAFQNKYNELVNAAKAQFATLKQNLKFAFESEVQEAKSAVENHLDAALDAEDITAEEAQKIKDLIAQYSPAV